MQRRVAPTRSIARRALAIALSLALLLPAIPAAAAEPRSTLDTQALASSATPQTQENAASPDANPLGDDKTLTPEDTESPATPPEAPVASTTPPDEAPPSPESTPGTEAAFGDTSTTTPVEQPQTPPDPGQASDPDQPSAAGQESGTDQSPDPDRTRQDTTTAYDDAAKQAHEKRERQAAEQDAARAAEASEEEDATLEEAESDTTEDADTDAISPQATTIPATDEASLAQAVRTAADGDVVEIQNDITLTNQVTVPRKAQTAHFTVRSAPGEHHTLSSSWTDQFGIHFRVDVGRDSKATFENITIEGGGKPGGLYIASGTVSLGSGATVKGCTGSMWTGGAIIVNGDTATLSVDGGEISGNRAATGGNQVGHGGGVWVNAGAVRVNSGAIRNNTANGQGGGVYLERGGTFTMTGGEVSGNAAENGFGGGVCISARGAAFTMSGGSISNNRSSSLGGGVYLAGAGTNARMDARVSGGTIQGNTSTTSGGAFALNANASLTLSGATAISDNRAMEGSGGAVYLSAASCQLNVAGGTLRNNKALGVNATGGAIGMYVVAAATEGCYANITITGGHFEGNTATAGHVPFDMTGNTYPTPTDYASKVSGVASLSLPSLITSSDDTLNKLYNGCDIFYTGGIATTPRPTQTVTFDPGYTGASSWTVRVDQGSRVTDPRITRAGYYFGGWWYTNASGAYTEWNFADPVTQDLSLKAEWTRMTFSISYDLAGGVNAPSNPATFSVEDEITLADPTRDGFRFVRWENAQGMSVTGIPKGTVGNISLVAIWETLTPATHTVSLEYRTLDESPLATQPATPSVQVAQNAPYTLIPDTVSGYKAHAYAVDGGMRRTDLATPLTVTGDIAVVIYYASTTIDVSFPTTMSFHVDETSHPNVENGPASGTVADYLVQNASEYPCKVEFLQMTVADDAGIPIVADATSVTGVRSLSLNITCPQSSNNAFTQGVPQIDPQQTYRTALGTLDGTGVKDASLTSTDGRLALSGYLSGTLPFVKVNPTLSLEFGFTLVTG